MSMERAWWKVDIGCMQPHEFVAALEHLGLSERLAVTQGRLANSRASIEAWKSGRWRDGKPAKVPATVQMSLYYLKQLHDAQARRERRRKVNMVIDENE